MNASTTPSLENMEQSTEAKVVGDHQKPERPRKPACFNSTAICASASATPNDTEALLRLPSVASQPKVVELNQAIAEAERQFTLLKQTYRAEASRSTSPTQTQIESLRRNRSQLLQDVVTLLRSERDRLPVPVRRIEEVQGRPAEPNC